jgi:hypothetical protein
MQTESTRNLEQSAFKNESQTDLEKLWFDTPPPSGVRRSSAPPPPPAEKVGEFLGDPDVDAWLR